MLKPRNADFDSQSGGIFSSRKQSQTATTSRMGFAENLDSKIDNMKRGKSNAMRETGNKTIDLSRYRGNLYKQTLAPNWSKTGLKEAQQKYDRITDDARRSCQNNSGLSNSLSPVKRSNGGDASARDPFMDTRLGMTN